MSIHTIGILGAGDVAQTLGAAWKVAGHEVMLGSRRPYEIQSALPVGSLQDAADFGGILVNATLGEVSLDVFSALTPASLDGKVLLDVSVGLAADLGSVTFPEVSGAEHLQNAHPALRVVKSLCTMTSNVMVNPSVLAQPTSVFVSGDDLDAKLTVSGLLRELGWGSDSQIDLGPLVTARGQEQFAMLYFALTQALGTGTFNIKVHTERAA